MAASRHGAEGALRDVSLIPLTSKLVELPTFPACETLRLRHPRPASCPPINTSTNAGRSLLMPPSAYRIGHHLTSLRIRMHLTSHIRIRMCRRITACPCTTLLHRRRSIAVLLRYPRFRPSRSYMFFLVSSRPFSIYIVVPFLHLHRRASSPFSSSLSLLCV